MARHRQGHGRRYGGSGQGRVPPSRRNRKNRRFSNKPLNKKKGYVRVCATYYYWKRR